MGTGTTAVVAAGLLDGFPRNYTHRKVLPKTASSGFHFTPKTFIWSSCKISSELLMTPASFQEEATGCIVFQKSW